MPARLIGTSGELAGKTFEIGEEAVVGRADDNAVCLDSTLVSSRHVRIRFDAAAGRYRVEDLDSLNGTALDGVALRRAEPLGHLHVLTLAEKIDLIFQDLDLCTRRATRGPAPAAASQERKSREGTAVEELPPDLPPVFAAPSPRPSPPPLESLEGTRVEASPVVLPGALAGGSEGTGEEGEGSKTRIEELPMVLPGALGGDGPAAGERAGTGIEKLPVPLPGSLAAGPAFVLEVGGESGGWQSFPLIEGENLVGRGEDAHVRLDSPENSRRHATVTVRGGRVTVRDEGSRNHTFVDDRQVEAETPVEPGQTIRFGQLEARLVHRRKDRSGGAE